MTYPSDFTDPQSVFGDLANLAIYPVTGIEQEVADTWRFHVTFSPIAVPPDVAVGTPLVYSYPTANGDYEIVKVVNCNRVGGTISVTRQEEGTAQLEYGPGGYLVQEPTAATYTALKNLLLLTQKHAGRMGDALPATCEPGMFYFLTTNGAFYACFSTDAWTRLDLVDHGALTGLADGGAHSIYYTLAQAMTWHAALSKSHLTSASTHDHSNEFSGACLPVRRFRCGNFASRPVAQHAGDIFVALDTKQIYISRTGATWEVYSTVPKGLVMFFAESCPTGWERLSVFDNAFPKGATSNVWTGLATGGATQHHHTISTLITHTHGVASYAVTSNQTGDHTHDISVWSGGGGDYVPFDPGDAASTGNLASGTDGDHTHTVTFPQVTTTSTGVASPATDDVDGRPSFYSLQFCRKQ